MLNGRCVSIQACVQVLICSNLILLSPSLTHSAWGAPRGGVFVGGSVQVAEITGDSESSTSNGSGNSGIPAEAGAVSLGSLNVETSQRFEAIRLAISKDNFSGAAELLNSDDKTINWQDLLQVRTRLNQETLSAKALKHFFRKVVFLNALPVKYFKTNYVSYSGEAFLSLISSFSNRGDEFSYLETHPLTLQQKIQVVRHLFGALIEQKLQMTRLELEITAKTLYDLMRMTQQDVIDIFSKPARLIVFDVSEYQSFALLQKVSQTRITPRMYLWFGKMQFLLVENSNTSEVCERLSEEVFALRQEVGTLREELSRINKMMEDHCK